MNVRIFAAAMTVLIACVLPSFASGESYTFDQTHSQISFKIHHFVGVASGRFSAFRGKIDIDREHPDRSSVVATIDARSLDTGIKKRDDHLRSGEFFDVAKFPQITFRSRRVVRTGPQSADVTGDLIMHGVTRPIVLRVRLSSGTDENANQTRWSVTTEPLKRREFGLMFSRTAEAVSGIGQEVSVAMEIEASKAP